MKPVLVRKNMLSEVCDRCGNDFATGQHIIHLPFIQKYIVLCAVCTVGLGIKTPEMINTTQVDWKKFWNSDYSNKEIIKLEKENL